MRLLHEAPRSAPQVRTLRDGQSYLLFLFSFSFCDEGKQSARAKAPLTCRTARAENAFRATRATGVASVEAQSVKVQLAT